MLCGDTDVPLSARGTAATIYGGMPDQRDMDVWLRRNEAAREADLAADRSKSMEQRLEEAAHLSRIATELRDNMRLAVDDRTG